MSVPVERRPFVATPVLTLGALLAAVAGLIGVLWLLGVVPVNPQTLGAAVILLALARWV